MSREEPETDSTGRDEVLMERVREHLNHSAGLSVPEAARLARARHEAYAVKTRSRRSHMPAYGLAMAASVTLVAALWLMQPREITPLPAQLAQLDDLELLLALDELELSGEPEFLAWALDERDR